MTNTGKSSKYLKITLAVFFGFTCYILSALMVYKESFAMTEKSIYVDAHGRFMPCCLQTEGNINSNVTEWFNSLISSWDTDPDKRCKRSCTKAINNLTTFKNQWTKEFILR